MNKPWRSTSVRAQLEEALDREMAKEALLHIEKVGFCNTNQDTQKEEHNG